MFQLSVNYPPKMGQKLYILAMRHNKLIIYSDFDTVEIGKLHDLLYFALQYLYVILRKFQICVS